MTDAQQEQQNSCSTESKENQTGLPGRKIFLTEVELKRALDYLGPITEWKLGDDFSSTTSANNVILDANHLQIDAHEAWVFLQELNSQNEYHQKMVAVLAFQIQQMAFVIQAQKDALAYCGVGLAEEKVMPS